MGDVDETETSPDGWLRVDYRVEPGRMSHWIRSPSVVDTRSGKTLFSLFSNWDADRAWGAPGVVTLSLRYYPEGGFTWISVTIDAGKGEGRIDDGDWRPLDGLAGDMEAAFEKKAATVRGRAGAMSTGSAHRPVNWKHFMAVMAGTGAILALVIAAGYFYEQHRTATPSAPLRAVPKPTPVPDPRRADDRAR